MPTWAVTLLSVIVGGFVTTFSQEILKGRDMRRERERAFFNDGREKLAQLEEVVAHFAHDQLLDPTSMLKDDMRILYRLEYGFFPYRDFGKELNRLILLRAHHASIAFKLEKGEMLSEDGNKAKEQLAQKTEELGREMILKVQQELRNPKRYQNLSEFEQAWQSFRLKLPWNTKGSQKNVK